MPDPAATTSPPAASVTGTAVGLAVEPASRPGGHRIVGLVIAIWLLASLLWTVTASIAAVVVVSALFAPWVMRLCSRGRSRNAAAAVVWASRCSLSC